MNSVHWSIRPDRDGCGGCYTGGYCSELLCFIHMRWSAGPLAFYGLVICCTTRNRQNMTYLNVYGKATLKERNDRILDKYTMYNI